MDKRSYERDRASLAERLRETKKQAADIESAIAGLDAAYALLAGNSPSPTQTTTRAGSDLAENIKKVALTMDGEYGVKELVQSIEDAHPGIDVARSTVGGILKRLEKQGKLEITQKGSGRRPSRYKVVQSSQNNNAGQLRMAD